MADVLVAGAGPAGWAVAAACAGHGLDTVLVDPDPHARWPATYGMWAGETSLLPAGSRWRDSPARVVAATSRSLAQRYAVLDNESVRTALTTAGVATVTGAVCDAAGGPRGCAVTLACGRQLAAAVVIDATGARRVLCGGPVGGPRAEQTAYGLVLPRAVEAAVFMDWRPPPGFGAGTFLYAAPLPDGATLFEETSLAARPGLDLASLRARLLARLAALDVPAGAGRVERVRIPLDLPVPRARPGVVAFGATAALVHPATGYSLADVFRLAPRVASAIALERVAPARAARAARRVLWPPGARAVRLLRLRGLAALLGMPPEQLARFFELFFGLPDELRQRYLGERSDVLATVATMTAIFGRADPALRMTLARHAVSGRPRSARPAR
ncbi:MAG: lycopene cyclase family protein [Labedaea sp.]